MVVLSVDSALIGGAPMLALAVRLVRTAALLKHVRAFAGAAGVNGGCGDGCAGRRRDHQSRLAVKFCGKLCAS